jgi:hypothetical protein
MARRRHARRCLRGGLSRRWQGQAGVVDIRGDGLMIGIELDRPCGDLVTRALERRPADQRHRRQGGAPAAAAGLQRCRQRAELVTSAGAADPEFLGAEAGDHAAPKHFLQLKDFARRARARLRPHALDQGQVQALRAYWPLFDRTLVMIFEKQSTRTRLSFEAGMHQLGGSAIYLSTRDSQLGRGEPVEDAAQVISRMCDIVMIRTFEQDIIERFAAIRACR